MTVALQQGGSTWAAVGLLTRGALGVSLCVRLVKAVFPPDDIVDLVPTRDNASGHQDSVFQQLSPAVSASVPGKVRPSLSSHNGR